ncbi:MAG: Holliday junction branch migration protein RuvA [Ignavibacteriota bacterium]|jgi:Holliday junction DNA helicase RuvA|nr:MAG: Holliday junction branch migration protein RuvA [Ignavibacterium sp.]MBL1154694.1 Holliday junction branch migration protein RuvA [Ignavibacteriota bacterium]MCO6446449.1 Holliday junction branch migration protein RuvA [Ignavibacterium album]MCZ2269695.1 Holliday junction branch migration protein RuvA [Ignavibacteriales bacterium]MDX9711636.1 Holliday junction branch migration protein RuvA [Ignavibacteriaceae bacterium]
MIGYLTGKIISSKPTQILLDVNGVGYSVNISINTFEKISEKESVSLFIFTNVKEDSITLFGFYTQSEKDMFELLISVSGIGPKVSMGILSGIVVDDLKEAISNGNISRLIAIPGIGRKTAERIVLELRNKVDSVKADGEVKVSSAKEEAVAALSTLGYQRQISEKVIRDLLSENPNYTLEELIRKALAGLNK